MPTDSGRAIPPGSPVTSYDHNAASHGHDGRKLGPVIRTVDRISERATIGSPAEGGRCLSNGDDRLPNRGWPSNRLR